MLKLKSISPEGSQLGSPPVGPIASKKSATFKEPSVYKFEGLYS